MRRTRHSSRRCASATPRTRNTPPPADERDRGDRVDDADERRQLAGDRLQHEHDDFDRQTDDDRAAGQGSEQRVLLSTVHRLAILWRIVKLGRNARFSTICLHAGQEPDPSTGAIITPIYQTSTYVQDGLGRHKGLRVRPDAEPDARRARGQPRRDRGRTRAVAFASGMAAINAIASLLESGDHVVMSDNVYGGTFRLFDKVLSRYQLSFTSVDTADLGPRRSGRSRRRPRCCSSKRPATR